MKKGVLFSLLISSFISVAQTQTSFPKGSMIDCSTVESVLGCKTFNQMVMAGDKEVGNLGSPVTTDWVCFTTSMSITTIGHDGHLSAHGPFRPEDDTFDVISELKGINADEIGAWANSLGTAVTAHPKGHGPEVKIWRDRAHFETFSGGIRTDYESGRFIKGRKIAKLVDDDSEPNADDFLGVDKQTPDEQFRGSSDKDEFYLHRVFRNKEGFLTIQELKIRKSTGRFVNEYNAEAVAERNIINQTGQCIRILPDEREVRKLLHMPND